MKTRNLIAILLISTLWFGYTSVVTKSYQIDKSKTSVEVSGTSSLHNWETTVTNFDGNLIAQLGANNTIEGISDLKVNFYAKSFSSGKSGMDTKTTEALKASTFPLISFKIISITDKKMISKVQQFTASGNLTIAGVTKPVSVSSFCAMGANGEIYFQGSKSIDMTQFGITPPTALMGTLTTGKDVTITFKLYFM